MIGTIENAEYAYYGEAHFLTRGTARDIYIADGVVYKVENGHEAGANFFEMDNLKRLTNWPLPAGIAIPEWGCFTVEGQCVIAMKYIGGLAVGECLCDYADTACDCPPESKAPLDIIRSVRSLDIHDMAVGNIILSDGLYYLVDLEG